MPRNPYPLKDGTNAPGVTTIEGQVTSYPKQNSLMSWSHRIAYDSTIELIKKAFNNPKRRVQELVIPSYEDIEKWESVRDSAGDVGSKVHECIIKFFTLETIDLTDKEVSKRFDKFLSWWYNEGNDAKMILAETPLVSEKLRFGGTPDLFIKINGKYRLVDIKTGGKWVYDEYWIQLAGYDILLKENGYNVDEYQILWLPKDDRFDCPIRTDLRKEKRIFKHLLAIYKERRE